MDIVIAARGLTVTEDLHDYVIKKVEKLERYMANIYEVRVELVEMNARNAEERQVAQMTARSERGVIMRAEESSSDILMAVDAAVDKLSRQIDRYKGKGKWRRRGKGRFDMLEQEALDAAMAEASLDEVEDVFEEELSRAPLVDTQEEVIRRKSFDIHPMTEDEAIEQLELLDHDFFVYYNDETATINVAYRRKSGGYGILEPVLS